MGNFRRILILTGLIIVAGIDILIYWNFHLYYEAEKIEDDKRKIKILEKANDIYPFNDLVYYKIGRTYFDLGFDNLSDKALGGTYLQKSIESLKRSIGINPASYFSHFNLAQSLLYESSLSPGLDIRYHEEYKKAVLLAGENSQVFYKVAKIFLSRWSTRSDEDKKFTLDILRKILSKKDREKLLSLLSLWEMNIRDYNIMERILPEDPQIYRIYADFLGEKSLSLEERQRILVKAEFLEFERAKKEYESGDNDFFYFRLEEASSHFKSSLNILKQIKFYQNLSPQKLIDISEFNKLMKFVLLNLAKCRIEQGKELNEVESSLRKYLSLEDKVSAISDLVAFLKNRGLIKERLEANFDDLDSLAFQLLLYFEQNRYREIVRIGRLLQKSFVVIPEEKKEVYLEVLNLVGDSYQKLDYIYDSGEFYRKALEIEPDNLETLLRILQNYKRLNVKEEISEINERIEEALSPKEFIFQNFLLNKGQSYSYTLVFDGQEKTLDLHFNNAEREVTPLISLFFNGYVIWEDYLDQEVLSLPIKSKTGNNFLRIITLNSPVYLDKLAYR